MARCLQLAALGLGRVAPNPLVGAVLVAEDRIIGEGFHAFFGGPHAEINCLASVSENDRHLIAQATMYVSLEPCAHWGKTPPCSNAIIQAKIPHVVVAIQDPFAAVNGAGIAQLIDAGIKVEVNVLSEQAAFLNRRFITRQQLHRPYIILKWAESADGFIGSGTNERWMISSVIAQQMVHKWRAEEDAIFIGTNTALLDNPSLTNRSWGEKQPQRWVLDIHHRLLPTLQVFDKKAETVVFTSKLNSALPSHIKQVEIGDNSNVLEDVMDWGFHAGIGSVLVEGGSILLKACLNMGLFDELRVINSKKNAPVKNGVKAPELPVNLICRETLDLGSDLVKIYNKAI